MTTPKAPHDLKLDYAIDWLECNEGKDGEAEACHEVAAWLKKIQYERMIYERARELGVTPARLRREIAKHTKQESPK